MLPDDCLTLILKNLPATLIVTVAEVSRAWKRVVEDLSNDEWKEMYQERVGWVVEGLGRAGGGGAAWARRGKKARW